MVYVQPWQKVGPCDKIVLVKTNSWANAQKGDDKYGHKEI